MEKILMISIYLLFYIGTATLFLVGLKIRKEPKKELINRDDSTYLKGVATVMVFLAHSQAFLETFEKKALIIKPFSVLGGLGVLIFFFLSGYGIYKGYAEKRATVKFWKNRILKVLIPALVISVVSWTIIYILKGEEFRFTKYIWDLLDSQWYVNVIMIEYAIFFCAWCLFGKNKMTMILMSTAISFVAGFIFWRIGLNPHWYNGVMLFPAGMIVASIEKKLSSYSEWSKAVIAVCSAFLFVCGSVFFVKFKGILIGDFFKMFAGICLALFLIFTLMFFEAGNRVILMIGKRSLFYYLCHLSILAIIKIFVSKGFLVNYIGIWFYVLLIVSIIYTEIMYQIFKEKDNKLKTGANSI